MFKKDQIETVLDDEILDLLGNIRQECKNTEDYAKMVDKLSTLYELRNKSRISKETMATIGANIIGILVVLSHERAHVITSKAFGFVKKIV